MSGLDREWLCHNGGLITAPADAPLTVERYGVVHRIWPDGLGALSQVLTACGKRGCTGEIGVPAPVDCPDCLEES